MNEYSKTERKEPYAIHLNLLDRDHLLFFPPSSKSYYSDIQSKLGEKNWISVTKYACIVLGKYQWDLCLQNLSNLNLPCFATYSTHWTPESVTYENLTIVVKKEWRNLLRFTEERHFSFSFSFLLTARCFKYCSEWDYSWKTQVDYHR